IDRVMTEAESPYVRLNSENEFEVVNDSFVKLLGYQNEPDLKETGSGTRRTFESILTPDSIRTYSEILKQSIQETFTDKYSIDMFKKNGEKIRAVVHGERIVFPTFRRKKYPPRFGIVIDYQNIDDQNKDTKKSGEESAENKN
ncbi:MAG TPA: hypothetical protein VK892_03490, partial [Pyrinomonadaceae bacterium]|nr:hypothetical protein [Pyrinomonadaceae bacterium]